jgi:hypothetical protein
VAECGRTADSGDRGSRTGRHRAVTAVLAANAFLDWLDTAKLAIIVGAVTALTGTVFGPLLTARSARKTAEHQHELNVGDERRRDRKELYVDLLRFFTQCNATIRFTYPVIGSSGDPDPPPWPADDSVHELEVRIAAFGSKPMRDAMKAWLDERVKFMHATWMIAQPTLAMEGRLNLEKHRVGLYELYDEMRDQVNAELRASLPV